MNPEFLPEADEEFRDSEDGRLTTTYTNGMKFLLFRSKALLVTGTNP